VEFLHINAQLLFKIRVNTSFVEIASQVNLKDVIFYLTRVGNLSSLGLWILAEVTEPESLGLNVPNHSDMHNEQGFR
jgi:hypothetical protein